MFRLFLFISILFGSLIIPTGVSASVTYTPGAIIAMTGSNSDVRFDVATALMGYDATIPVLETATRTFTGAFYGSGIGWINFSTGSYQVSLNCGAQYLSGLTSNCTLTGTGWSENVGDIYFSSGTTITYDRITGYLSGSVITFAGNLSLDGIILPLKPITLNEASMIANHNATLTVSGAWMYEGGANSWNGKVTIGLGIQSITGINGLYTPVDLSLAGTYTITIEDPNNSTTAISGFKVSPGVLSTTLDGSSFYAKTFCTTYAPSVLLCPDGATRITTSLIQIPPTGPVVANGSDFYQFIPKIRDDYGNKITAGTMKITYNTSVSNVQINDNPDFTTPVCADAINILGFGFTDACGNWNAPTTPTDVQYMIWSTAPTNATNIIQLSSIIYTSGSTVIPLSFSTAPLVFTPLYTASISAPAPTIGIPHTFTATVVKNDATTLITPTIINTLKVGPLGNFAEWKDLSSTPGATCVNYQGSLGVPLCNWNNILDEKASIATPWSSSFTFTGTYKLTGSFPPPTTTNINTYVYYNNGTDDILYSAPPTTIIPQAIIPTLRLRIFGQSEKWMNLGPQNRVDLINSIRKNIALLSRNRTDYTTADHIISTGNKTITNADFSPGNKRSIIVVGGDISITQNIPKYTHPIAIIALTDANGNGGNITISGSVTDIHSTLIAEHAILSETSNKQLYINGSVISSNPPQDIPSTTCPYFVTGPCISTNYDLPEFRSTYDSTAPNASIGGSMYFAPLIIEIDPRLITDAPPAINK